MSNEIKRLIESLEVTEKAPAILPVLVAGKSLPDDFIELYKYSNGGEGFLGDGYIIIWRAEELENFNVDYEVAVYAPGIILFGSNGGGEAFGFDTSSEPYKVVQLPFVGMSHKYARIIAVSFSDFLNRLKCGDENIY